MMILVRKICLIKIIQKDYTLEILLKKTLNNMSGKKINKKGFKIGQSTNFDKNIVKQLERLISVGENEKYGQLKTSLI